MPVTARSASWLRTTPPKVTTAPAARPLGGAACPARGSAEELWSQETKNSWPAQDLEDYNNLKAPLQHFAIADLWQYIEWNDHKSLSWKLEGCDGEPIIGLTGPDDRDKTSDDSSMLFPVVCDSSKFRRPDKDAEDDQMVVGDVEDDQMVVGDVDDDFEGVAIASELLIVRGSMGCMRYNDNKNVHLWEGCSFSTVNAMIFPVEFNVTMPVQHCAMCFEVREKTEIGPCGHTFCTGCLAELEQRRMRKCPMCRGAAAQLKRTSVWKQDIAKQLAASAADAKKRTAPICEHAAS